MWPKDIRAPGTRAHHSAGPASAETGHRPWLDGGAIHLNRGAFQEYTRVPDDSSALLSYFVFTTWFLDLLPTAPCVSVIGTAFSEIAQLFRVLHCLCRR